MLITAKFVFLHLLSKAGGTFVNDVVKFSRCIWLT
jgi:hypothetical protein